MWWSETTSALGGRERGAKQSRLSIGSKLEPEHQNLWVFGDVIWE